MKRNCKHKKIKVYQYPIYRRVSRRAERVNRDIRIETRCKHCRRLLSLKHVFVYQVDTDRQPNRVEDALAVRGWCKA